ncbi:hypothetical protein ABPG72_007806 [Tetrahymena utriculariae]
MQHWFQNQIFEVKQWFHNIYSYKEIRDFIQNFIQKLIDETDEKLRIVIFFNNTIHLQKVFQEIKSDRRFSNMADNFNFIYEDQKIELRKQIQERFNYQEYKYLLATRFVADRCYLSDVCQVIN